MQSNNVYRARARLRKAVLDRNGSACAAKKQCHDALNQHSAIFENFFFALHNGPGRHEPVGDDTHDSQKVLP